jgi:hypothetical protein
LHSGPHRMYGQTNTNTVPLTPYVQIVLSLTQENAVDLHSVGSPLTLPTTVGGKHIDRVKNMGLYLCMTFFPLVDIC